MAAPDAPPNPEAAKLQAQNLTAAKEARKRAELDAQLLANRIALLRQEEEKAWNKIHHTRRRANEIVTQHDQNVEKFMAKELYYKNKWESIKQAQARNASDRERSKGARNSARMQALEDKKKNVQATKLQAQDHLAQMKDRGLSERQANADRSLFIKQQKIEAKKRMETDRKAKLDQYHDHYEARCAEEDMLRARTQALVAQMEKEEMELIQSLQQTQIVQRQAYEQLEGALGQCSQQISGSARMKSGGKVESLPPIQ